MRIVFALNNLWEPIDVNVRSIFINTTMPRFLLLKRHVQNEKNIVLPILIQTICQFNYLLYWLILMYRTLTEYHPMKCSVNHYL